MIDEKSPLTVALNHTEVYAPTYTFPIIEADGAMNAILLVSGLFCSNEYIIGYLLTVAISYLIVVRDDKAVNLSL